MAPESNDFLFISCKRYRGPGASEHMSEHVACSRYVSVVLCELAGSPLRGDGEVLGGILTLSIPEEHCYYW